MLIITFYLINLDYHLNSVRNDEEQKKKMLTTCSLLHSRI